MSPYLPEGKRGRPPFAPEAMLRIHFMQQWFNLSDSAMEEALHDMPLFREFAGLEAKGLMLKSGTVVDATLIAAPSSTKNASGERDPDMKQSKKGQQWCVSRTQAADLWCCTEDGSRPPEAGLQEQASNHPVLLRSKGAVVSDRGKVIP